MKSHEIKSYCESKSRAIEVLKMPKIIILASICLVFLIFVFVLGVKFAVNVSDSMPRGIYVMTGILNTNFRKNKPKQNNKK